jgi:hypothetical protein
MSCSTDSAKLISITVTPVDPVSVVGTQFTATGTFSDGMILNYTSEVIWSSSIPTLQRWATAGIAGYVTVLKEGTTTIMPSSRTIISQFFRAPVVTPSTITITWKIRSWLKGQVINLLQLLVHGTGSQS